jgi:hypothetical protein
VLNLVDTQLIDIVAIALRHMKHVWDALLIWTFPVRDHEVYVIPVFRYHVFDCSCLTERKRKKSTHLAKKDVVGYGETEATILAKRPSARGDEGCNIARHYHAPSPCLP